MRQERTPLDSNPDSTSFAGLLASLTGSKSQKSSDRVGNWPGDSADGLVGLEDDVATLSYERALQTHARYKPAAVEPPGFTVAGNQTVTSVSAPGVTTSHSAAAASLDADRVRERKCASVTVRMSEVEAAQLQQRAAEAGLTVSAYLRSCTFEVEALRAQVKQALTELRATQAVPNVPSSTPPPRPSWLHLFRHAVAPES